MSTDNDGPAPTSVLRGVTERTRGVVAPVRRFLGSESGSAGVLVAAVVAALVWCNVAPDGYERVWHTMFAIRLGDWGISREIRTWVNSGLMAVFFFVVGLEARREFDLGDLRERRRFVLPCAAGLAGMLVPACIYLAVTHGGPGSHGWGVAMSTDTALALGLLSLFGRRVPRRVHAFLLSVFVVDDIASLVVVTLVYSAHISAVPIVVAVVCLGLVLLLRRRPALPFGAFALAGVVAWVAVLQSGVDPIVVGLIIGLLTTAYSPSRSDLERASGLFRLFREQPTAELARNASVGLSSTLSPNDRLLNRFLPLSSYVIVPLFGLANAGIKLSGRFLSDAFTSPITWGIIAGYLVGKPIGVVGGSWLVERLTRGRLRPEVGWASVSGSGTIAGIGFTVSFVIANLAFDGENLAEAKFGVLAAGVIATGLTWLVYRVTAMLPANRRARALLGDVDQIVDLATPVDPERDHVRGPANASVTLVEYGDLQCPYCGQAEPVVRDLMSDVDLRYVWRHLPLTDVHPQALLAAEASEAAAAQGKFWEMHDRLLTEQDHLRLPDLLGYAKELSLDTDRFYAEVSDSAYAAHIAEDVDSADLSGVSGTPTFFVNGQRHYGAYDLHSLKQSIKLARLRVAIRAGDTPQDTEPSPAGH